MNSKQDKECERGDDIILLSEIIKNSRYWQSAIEAFLILVTFLMKSQLFGGVG